MLPNIAGNAMVFSVLERLLFMILGCGWSQSHSIIHVGKGLSGAPGPVYSFQSNLKSFQVRRMEKMCGAK